MSVSIKLSRTGARNNAYYRIVAAPTRSKRDGRNLDIIGSYNPRTKEHELDKSKLDLWVKNGAILSTGVAKILKK